MPQGEDIIKRRLLYLNNDEIGGSDELLDSPLSNAVAFLEGVAENMGLTPPRAQRIKYSAEVVAENGITELIAKDIDGFIAVAVVLSDSGVSSLRDDMVEEAYSIAEFDWPDGDGPEIHEDDIEAEAHDEAVAMLEEQGDHLVYECAKWYTVHYRTSGYTSATGVFNPKNTWHESAYEQVMEAERFGRRSLTLDGFDAEDPILVGIHASGHLEIADRDEVDKGELEPGWVPIGSAPTRTVAQRFCANVGRLVNVNGGDSYVYSWPDFKPHQVNSVAGPQATFRRMKQGMSPRRAREWAEMESAGAPRLEYPAYDNPFPDFLAESGLG